jgi:hypothetical protein
MTCLAGVIGNNVRCGYQPWKNALNGEPLWAYQQACTVQLQTHGDGYDGPRI